MNKNIVLTSLDDIYVKDIPDIFTQALHAISVDNDDNFIKEFRYHVDLIKFQDAIKMHIENGQLTQRCPTTKLPTPQAHGYLSAHGSVVTVEDLTKFAKQIGFNVIIQNPAPVKVSQAPAPISPLRGGSGATVTPTWTKADWNHWQQMPHCKIWDIVALSLDLEPSNAKQSVRTWPQEYENRMQITEAHIKSGKLKLSNADNQSIDIEIYGKWALSLGWNIPDRFPRGEVAIQSISNTEKLVSIQSNISKPWEIINPSDPTPEQPWYTPARYFARQLIVENSTLLLKRNLLAEKVSNSLYAAGIFGRKKNKKLDGGTVLKAFNNVLLS